MYRLSSIGSLRPLWTRWKDIALPSAILLATMIAGMTITPTDVRYYGALSSNSLPDNNLSSDLSLRSPGPRIGDTLQKKAYYRPLATERVLSGVRETPITYEDWSPFSPSEINSFSPPPLFSTPYLPDRVSYFSPPLPFTAGPGGLDYPGTVSEPVAAVPELSTWAMMIIGFFGTGLTIRRRLHIPGRHGLTDTQSNGCG
jgi:hypothetical protein